MTDPKASEEFRRKALEKLRVLQAHFGEHTEEDERELQSILGDSPEPEDVWFEPKGARPRSKSASTPTA